jgi:hypothetical protein
MARAHAHLLHTIPLSCLLLLSAGCSKAPPPATPEAAPPEPGHIYVYRPEVSGGFAVTANLLINGTDAGALAQGDTISVEKPPGDYELSYKCSAYGLSCYTSGRVSFTLKPGEARYIRTEVTPVPSKVVPDLIDPEQGAREVARLKNSN